MTDHLSTLKLHQLRLGELEPPARRAARDHLDACETCRGRLRHQEHVRAEFVLRPMPEALRRPAPSGFSGWRWAVPLLVGVAALGLVILRAPEEPGIRTRGVSPAIEVWVEGDRGPRLLLDDEPLGEGARIGIKYDPAGAPHVALAGRDGRDVVDVFAIFEAEGTGLQNAPFGLELDDAPGDQELFLVTAERPLDPELVKEAVRSSVEGLRVERTVIDKLDPVRAAEEGAR